MSNPEHCPRHCPLCGGSVEPDRDIERLVREGEDVALVRVRADVCGDCGEVFLHPGMADRIVQAKATLRRGGSVPARSRC